MAEVTVNENPYFLLCALFGGMMLLYGVYGVLFARFHYRPMRWFSWRYETLRGGWAVVIGSVFMLLGGVGLIYGLFGMVAPQGEAFAMLGRILPIPAPGRFTLTNDTGGAYDGAPFVLVMELAGVMSLAQLAAWMLPSDKPKRKPKPTLEELA
jgi:hypothetical protein